MAQADDQASQQAEARAQETHSFVRRVRAAARRKYTPEEKTRIVLEGFRREVAVNDLCRREGIRYSGLGKQAHIKSTAPSARVES